MATATITKVSIDDIPAEPGEDFLGYSVHPAANALPMLPKGELQELADDIAQHGQNEPIVLLDGVLLDGRNRLAACRIAGVEPKIRSISSINLESPTAFVVSANMRRRQLTQSQLAILAAEIEPLFAAEAKKRMSAKERAKLDAEHAEKQKAKTDDLFSNKPADLGKKKSSTPPPVPVEPFRGRARDQAAEAVGVSPAYTNIGKRLIKADPEMAEKVKKGEVSLTKARDMVFPKMESIKEKFAREKEEKKAPRREIKRAKSRSGKVESSRVTLQLICTFGSDDVAQDIMQTLDDDPRVISMIHSVVE